jgi:hypothetical protein
MAAGDSPDTFFEQLAEASDAVPVRAPSRLKSRTYSAMVRAAQRGAPLCTLGESKAAGRGLCVFEELAHIAPVGEAAKRVNWCEVCHARVLGERVEGAPIFWANCPYVRFQNR